MLCHLADLNCDPRAATRGARGRPARIALMQTRRPQNHPFGLQRCSAKILELDRRRSRQNCRSALAWSSTSGLASRSGAGRPAGPRLQGETGGRGRPLRRRGRNGSRFVVVQIRRGTPTRSFRAASPITTCYGDRGVSSTPARAPRAHSTRRRGRAAEPAGADEVVTVVQLLLEGDLRRCSRPTPAWRSSSATSRPASCRLATVSGRLADILTSAFRPGLAGVGFRSATAPEPQNGTLSSPGRLSSTTSSWWRPNPG